MSVWCVVLAAGRGTRSGLEENKVFFRWQGRSVLSRCLDALAASNAYDGIALVLSESDLPRYRELTAREGKNPLVKRIAMGGDTRRESGYSGLMALPEGVEIVSVHDAARPFVTEEIVRATIADAQIYGSGVISTPVVDTIKCLDPVTGLVTTPDRSRLRAVQTPQSFQYVLLMAAHERARRENLEVTDDAMLYEHQYGSVHLSSAPGAEKNIKLTNPEDFRRLNAAPALRIGSGYDAHRLKEGRRLVLCGVEVPHDRGLDGHSDADVAVHALMDALLGALGEGDIGRHFPDSDPRYKGISSMLLLEGVMCRVRERGYRVMNADVTIVAQKPKLAAHIPQMRQNLAAALGVDADCANVKATTTERMGFEGEELGISAQAVALLTRE
ncbi:MAG: 2-C-methyl-D-erythritol 2,4-cyclodiphosphate synthase [Eubacteriales bacterium]|nr:2-C-methyl-D-erythritol 2,4-cyclodiphosphate synthase [Eubacteriales bacterium]